MAVLACDGAPVQPDAVQAPVAVRLRGPRVSFEVLKLNCRERVRIDSWTAASLWLAQRRTEVKQMSNAITTLLPNKSALPGRNRTVDKP